MPQPQIYNKLGLAVLFLLVVVILSSKALQGPFADNMPTFEGFKFPELKFTSTFEFAFRSQGLSKVVNDNLAGKEGEYAVYIKDLSDADLIGADREVYSLRGSEIFPAASLYKLFLMAAVLKEIENGRLKMEDRVSGSKDHLTEVLGSVDFGYENAPEEIEYTVEVAMQRVGRVSDNFASLMLAEKIGWERVQKVADELGAFQTTIKSPISTSAADIGRFFEQLYKGEVVSARVSEQIIEFLSLNQLDNRIPAKLPEDVKVVHKTGELSRIRHDAGIVYLEDRPYILVIMSKELEDEDEGVENMAKLSKDIYDYFASKSGN